MDPNRLKTRSPFSTLFKIDDETCARIEESMRARQFDPAFPIIVWDGVVIDGHTRLKAALSAGLDDVVVIEREYASDYEALTQTFKAQRLRRNISQAEMLLAIEAVDQIKPRGGDHKSNGHQKSKTSAEVFDNGKGRTSAEETAADLGVSRATVERARAVLSDADAKKAVVEKGTTIRRAAGVVTKKRKAQKAAASAAAPKSEAKAPAERKQAVLPPLSTRGLYLPPPDVLEDLRRKSDAKFNEQKNTDIEWAMWSWNPVTGCKHDCTYCYARVIAHGIYAQKFEPTFIPERLGAPRNTKVPEKAAEEIGWKNVFVCSMADLWGKWVQREVIEAVMREVREQAQWNYLFLTKFPDRYLEFKFPPQTWVGTSVDTQAVVERAEKSFKKLRAAGHKGVRWLSVEPMLDPIKFSDLSMFDWMVIGAQSGWDQNGFQIPEFTPPYRWYHDLISQAIAARIPVYMKDNLGVKTRLREYPGGVR